MQREKFALVTGCGQGGIGEALVKTYQQKGIHAIATILPHESADHLSDANITYFPLDVTVEESVEALKNAVHDLTGGQLDILVNCAGIAYTMTAIDTDVKAVQRMFDINLFGPMRMVRTFHPMLIATKGTIINIGSIGGIIPFMYGSSYNASKAALAHWGNTLRVEMSPFSVQVVTVISGEISTNILRNDANRTLPQGSFYAPLAENFKDHCTRTPANATDRFQYANSIVSMSLRRKAPIWHWYGSFTGLTRFFDIFGYRAIWDSIMWNMFSLQKLKDYHITQKQKSS